MKEVEFSPVAHRQLKEWETEDIKIYERIEQLIEAIQDDPYRGIGKPEPLKYQFKSYWSRRINREHRLVYKVTEKSIIIAACKYHY